MLVDPFLLSIAALAALAALVLWLIRNLYEPEAAQKDQDGQPGADLRDEEPDAPPIPKEEVRVLPATIVEKVMAHIVFSKKIEVIGHRQVGWQKVGEREVEVPYRTDQSEIRPMQGMNEIQLLMPSERMMDDSIGMIRAVSGEALVETFFEQEDVMAPIEEPIILEKKVIAYLLLDRSPSMYGAIGMNQGHSDFWAIPIWKGLSVSILDEAMRKGADFMLRCFGDGVIDLVMVRDPQYGCQAKEVIESGLRIGGTNITHALQTAMADLEQHQFDEANIMIVTDGDDQCKMDLVALRAELDAKHMRLHAILLGTSNESLRKIADSYQLIPDAQTVHPPVARKK